MKKGICFLLCQIFTCASLTSVAQPSEFQTHPEYISQDETFQTKGTPNFSKRLLNLRKQLATILNDIDETDFLLGQYRKLVRNTKISNKERDLLEKWLVDKCIFLGSKKYNHSLLFARVPELKRNEDFRKHYKLFTKKIKAKPKDVFPDIDHEKNQNESLAENLGVNALGKDHSRKRITVLYTGCYGAGHRSPATALANHLEKEGHKVQLIDIDEVQNKYSPKVQGYTRAQIYAEVYQKEGNPKKAHALSERIERAHKPEARRFMIDLKKMILKHDSDLIFTVAHHRPNLGYLSYQLNIPMVYVHTDHVFHRSLVFIVKEQMRLKQNLIYFTVLSDSKEFYKNIYEELKLSGGKLPPSVQKQLVRLDFPVRESFQPVTKREKNEIRDSLNVPRESIVCKLAMGQNALASEMKDLLSKFIKQDKKLSKPLHVFTICGKNDSLKQKLEHLVQKKLNPKSKLHIDICGFKQEKEMAQIDQASDVWFTKPGGSTSAECVQTKKQMLYVIASGHPWEKTNARYLESLNLASKLSSKKPFLKQIEKRIKVAKQLDAKDIPDSKWQKQANRIVWKCTHE